MAVDTKATEAGEAGIMAADAVPAAHEVRMLVEDFLYTEAALLDAWQLDEWLALFAGVCRYVVPSTDLPDGDPDRDVVLIDDDRELLEARVERLKSRFAYREYPWSRTRRLITNVRVREAGPDLLVTANFAVHRFRHTSGTYVGHYEYLLARSGDELRIRLRRAVLDNESLDEHGAVSIIL
jgi:p-cumate 2,3-dioxygenase beta subunit